LFSFGLVSFGQLWEGESAQVGNQFAPTCSGLGMMPRTLAMCGPQETWWIIRLVAMASGRFSSLFVRHRAGRNARWIGRSRQFPAPVSLAPKRRALPSSPGFVGPPACFGAWHRRQVYALCLRVGRQKRGLLPVWQVLKRTGLACRFFWRKANPYLR
jgi:hypothetical protein